MVIRRRVFGSSQRKNRTNVIAVQNSIKVAEAVAMAAVAVAAVVAVAVRC